jgi:hypothetical protein
MKRFAPHVSPRLRPVGALWPISALALAASACGQARDEGAPSQAPLVTASDPGAIVRVHDCNAEAGYAIHSYEGASTGDDLLALSVYDAGGEATIHDTRATPHDLALSVYKATRWRIEAAPRSGLRRVLVAGFNPQAVDAPPGVEVVDLNAGRSRRLPIVTSLAPDGDSSDPEALVRALQAVAGTSLTAFAFCSNASDFSINDGPGAGHPHPFDPCATDDGPRVALATGADCASGRPIVPSAERSCADAQATCRRYAEQNPGQNVSCTWDGQIVYEREAAPGACTDPGQPDVCAGTRGEGRSVVSFCEAVGGFGLTDGTTCAEAYDNCLLNAESNPDGNIFCTWNDLLLFKREQAPGACEVGPTSTCSRAKGTGTLVGVDCSTGERVFGAPDLECYDALVRCFTESAPLSVSDLACSWQGAPLQAIETTPGACGR